MKSAILTHNTSVQFTRQGEEILVLLCLSDCDRHLNQLSEFLESPEKDNILNQSVLRPLHHEVGFTFILQHRHDELL